MPTIKRLYLDDVKLFRDTITRFIYESSANVAYRNSICITDAEQKYTELINYINEDKAIVYGAIEDNALIGFVWAYEYPFREDKSRVYVSILHVDDQHRGQRVGNHLLSSVEKEASKNGYGSVFLHAEAFNDGAIRFYNRMGYETERIQLVKKQLIKNNISANGMSENGGGTTSEHPDD